MASDIYSAIGMEKSALTALAARYELCRLAVFGSFARGEEKPDSDIDFLAEWPEGRLTFRNFMGVREDLEQATGRKIDLATPDALHWYIKDKILSEARDLL